MSEGQQPRPELIFPEEKKRNKGRIWLIVGLSVLAVAVIGVLLFFLIPRDGEAAPTTSPSASATPTTTPSSTPSPAATATSDPNPTTEPAQTPPPAPDPDLDTFREQVQPRLDDATRGLQLVKDNIDLGAQIVDSLQNDAAALSDTPAPSSISGDWSAAVSQYASKLSELRASYDNGTDPQAPLAAAGKALQKARALVGL